MERILRHTLGPSGRHTRPVHQWHIQLVIGPITFHPTVLSPYDGPSCVGERNEGSGGAILESTYSRSLTFQISTLYIQTMIGGAVMVSFLE